MPNKRDFERFSEGGKVKIILKDNAQTKYDGTLVDFSCPGFCVLVKEKIAIGTEVRFELRTRLEEMVLKGEGTVKNIAEVKQDANHGFRLGIAFTKADKEEILMFLNQIEFRISEERKKGKGWFNTPGISPI